MLLGLLKLYFVVVPHNVSVSLFLLRCRFFVKLQWETLA